MSKKEVIVVLLVVVVSVAALPNRPQRSDGNVKVMSVAEDQPEVNMDVTELITSQGYPCENHWVTTPDGYILNLQRIPHGRPITKAPRPVVLLQHGLLLSSAIFLLNSPESSLGFLLADSGLDVWLANSRGNIYSTNHTHLDPHTDQFWDFSWDEMAQHDLPAVIDYILAVTGEDQLSYVGYSQGTTIGFAALSQTPTLADKTIMKLFPHGNVDVDRSVSRHLVGHVCHQRKDRLCEMIFSMLVGSNPTSFDMSQLEIYMAHMPAGTSVRNLLHWAQAAQYGKFQHFDWGSPEANLKKYGQSTPPRYDLSHVKTPVAIFRGGQDALADTEDIRWLLPQLHVLLDVAVHYYNHMDFIAAPDAPEKIYSILTEILLS